MLSHKIVREIETLLGELRFEFRYTVYAVDYSKHEPVPGFAEKSFDLWWDAQQFAFQLAQDLTGKIPIIQTRSNEFIWHYRHPDSKYGAYLVEWPGD
jgi:hypothetical protein